MPRFPQPTGRALSRSPVLGHLCAPIFTSTGSYSGSKSPSASVSNSRTLASRSAWTCSRRCRDRAIRHGAEHTVCRPVNGVPHIGQDHVSKGACVLVVAVGLDGHVLPKGEVRGGVLGVVAVGLALLRTVNTAEADTFSAVVVQDFEGIAVEDGDDGAGEVGGPQFARSHEQIKYSYRN